MPEQADLDLARAQQLPSAARKDDKTENVIKMFTDPDKIAAIKAEMKIVKIGNPLTEAVIRPLNPKQGVEAFKLLRTALLPLISLYRNSKGGNLTLADFFDAFGDNIEALPKLLHIILSRGNPDIDEEWVAEKLDLVPDTLTILPIFMEQNMFDKIFSPKVREPQQGSLRQNGEPPKSAEDLKPPSPTTEESLAPSSS